ncbi:hypothetical protein EJB05_09914, partial [Eragrostis curvula]
LEVSKADYDSCSSSSPISAFQTGDDTITLAAAGVTRYFICGVPGHCDAGMKLAVRVEAVAAAGPNAAAPSPTPIAMAPRSAGPPMGTPSAGGRPALPPSSSAASAGSTVGFGTMARVQASLLAVAIVAAAAAFMTASGASYTVGEPGGSWDLQTNLTAWASSIEFQSGDELVFKYSAATHDVVEVDRSGYRSCSAASPVSKFQTGDDTVQLGGVGVRYFICGVPGHCAAGMKLEVRTTPRKPLCNSPPPPAGTTNAPPGLNGTPGGICVGDGDSPTVIISPSYTSGSVAPGSSGSVSSVLVIMLLLLGITF